MAAIVPIAERDDPPRLAGRHSIHRFRRSRAAR